MCIKLMKISVSWNWNHNFIKYKNKVLSNFLRVLSYNTCKKGEKLNYYEHPIKLYLLEAIYAL